MVREKKRNIVIMALIVCITGLQPVHEFYDSRFDGFQLPESVLTIDKVCSLSRRDTRHMHGLLLLPPTRIKISIGGKA